jgi:starch phosphorylase
MKAAHNGVPSLSIPDGWWPEGCVEGITGWAIGPPDAGRPERTDAEDAADLYATLEHRILPRYREPGEAWARLMRSTIAFNASFFNTQRMLQQYVAMAYPAVPRPPAGRAGPDAVDNAAGPGADLAPA